MAKLDDEARQKIESILKQLQAGGDFSAIAKKDSEDILTKNQGGDWGTLPKGSDDPSGIIEAASKLQPKQLSGVVEGVDGFYIVKLLEKRDTGDLHIARIFVAYKVLDKKIAELRKKDLIQEFLHLNTLQQATSQ
jgi:parvulin-like peptidyl-prolyl isomerase